jgi:hypothetical protein
MTVGLAQRSVRAVWHPCTQMKLHEGHLPVGVARAQGPWLYGADGTRHLDGISSWWVNLFGHSHPAQLANLEPYPEPVPINHLVRVQGTPLAQQEPLDPFEFVRTIAAARITMPKARVRLSAGRREMGDAVQALCFMAGASSIFYGDKLLTTGNPDTDADRILLDRLGLHAGQP